MASFNFILLDFSSLVVITTLLPTTFNLVAFVLGIILVIPVLTLVLLAFMVGGIFVVLLVFEFVFVTFKFIFELLVFVLLLVDSSFSFSKSFSLSFSFSIDVSICSIMPFNISRSTIGPFFVAFLFLFLS